MKQRAQPTSYKNEAEQQTAGILFKLIMATGIGFLFGGLIGIYINDVMGIVTMSVGIALLIVPFILLKRRQVISAGTILILLVMGTLTASATTGQGLNDLAIFAFPITYFFASMFMNRNVFRICLAFSMLAIFWLVFGELNGWFVPKPAIPTGWVNFAIVLVILLIAAFVSDLLATKMRKNLERAEQEITQRRQVEQELIKEQALLKTTLEATADGILVVARDGTWSIFNKKFLDMWGIPASISESRDDEAALNHVVGSLAHPEEFAAKVKELYENIEAESLDIVELKDGRTFKRYSQPQHLNEEIVGRAWSFRDITERKLAEEKFTHQSIQRQNLLIMGRQITSSLDTDQVFNYISEQVRILLGSYGVTIYMLDSQGKELTPVLTYPPDYSEEVLSANLDLDSSLTGRVIKARQGMIFNYADEQLDGYHIPGTPVEEDHLMIAPFIINEKAVGSLNIYRKPVSFSEEDLALAETFTLYASTAINNARAHQDLLDQIDERKQAERALAKSNSLRELLLDIITHDLKNPAGVIFALAEATRQNMPENKSLEAIYTSSGRLMDVLNQTTILSQAAFGESIPKETLSLDVLLKETIDEFAYSLNTAKMELVVASAPDVIIEANPLIGEVFKNYISNAIKYARDGKRIEIETVVEDQTVIVCVKDFGKTIAEADRDQIFERQIQLENGKERGRGLGLAIVKRIALAHAGEVWVEPNTPVGNRFCLRIPL